MRLIILYGSSTGNTARMAAYIAAVFKNAGIEPEVKPVSGVEPSGLSDYDAVLLGSSTWGNGSLQEAMKSFYFKIDGQYLASKKAAVFGAGDSRAYPRSFCKAVDLLQNKLKANGAEIILPGLKLDGEASASKEAIVKWALEAVSALKK
jgi:flavodoxin I